MGFIKREVKPTDQSKARVDARIDDYYNEAAWPVLAVAQIFAVMPVSGLRHENPKFKWFSVPAIFSSCYSVAVGLLFYLKGRQTLNGKVNTSNSGGLVFYVSIIMSFNLFFILARKWNKLIYDWREKEEIFLHPPYERHGWKLRWKVRSVAALFLGLAIFEHGISLVRNVSNYTLRVSKCSEGVIQDHWIHYFRTEYSIVFSKFQFNPLLAILIVWINLLMSVAWSYSDIFIIMVSLALSTRFKQLNNRIYCQDLEAIDHFIWSEIRQHYVLLCELLEIVDKNLAPLILVACANNLYFICYQLVNIFDELPNIISYVYFWFSLVLLMIRTLSMFLCSSEIHDASQKPLEMIRKIPSCEWFSELDRFSDQLTNETVALSGMKFFFITRKLVLAMIGTIITYELVLLQFDSKLDPDTIKKELKEFCNLK